MFEVPSIADVKEEIFGPVLQVVRWGGDPMAVIQQINALGYGLTLGIQTRIDSRAQALAAAARVGNVYVNRNMIGAVVGVQPFGGEGLSGTGPKAGGPHYLLRFCAEQTLTINTTAAGGNVALFRSSSGWTKTASPKLNAWCPTWPGRRAARSCRATSTTRRWACACPRRC
jgi:RHH-type transcriptional regulator, proline utilization regulon repressor / proline dehydrogenase / delta 1-pyrroline-5-carboxylate dehydrogenase